MSNPVTLAFGLILGLSFAGVLVFKVLPVLDHSMKKERGPVHACLITRFCALCVALPLYVFTVWMTLVVLVDEEKGISVLEEICPDDLSCYNTFSMGRTNFDKEACTSADCGEENLLARSGSQPLNFPRLGLGQDLEPLVETVEYSCTENSEDCTSIVQKNGINDGEICSCEESVDLIRLSNQTTLCPRYVGCDNDIVNSTSTFTLTGESSFAISTDSAKQFMFQECVCNDASCRSFTCENLTMEYFYPNVFYAGLVTVLFVLPLMLTTYTVAKTQLRKVIQCTEAEVFVYSQEAGMQNENTAENLATGGFTRAQEEKTKYRSCSKKDVIVMILGPAAITFFTWLTVVTAGRVGVAFVSLSAGLIALKEIISAAKVISRNNERMEDRIERNNPDAERAVF